MIITESEIWYTYSTYVLGGVKDLNAAGRLLVESGLALCAMHRDGQTYWKGKTGLRFGITEIKLNEKGNRATIHLHPHGSGEPDFASFAQEAWYQSARLRYGEIHLFGDDYFAPPPYIRAFLGECALVDEKGDADRVTTCYPIIKLYASGVLIVEMRTILTIRPLPVSEFIDEYLNIHTRGFNLINVPPALAKMAPRTYENYYGGNKRSIVSRFRLSALEAGHDTAIDQLTESRQSGDFTFETAPLPSSFEEGKRETLLSLVLTVFEVIGFTISAPRQGLPLLLRGQKRLIKRGGFWQKRPHVHILRYEDQAETAKENEVRHRESLNRIFLTTSAAPGAHSRHQIPRNARTFDDYGAYVAPQAVVWMWSKNGLDRENEWQDPNRGHLIYPNQACGEMLEYGYMTYRSLSESILSAATSKDVMALRRAVLDLGGRLRQSSHFGEIASLLEDGWKSMRVEDLKSDIEAGLAVRESETRAAETRTTEAMGWILTIIFGMIAIPPFAGEVVTPLWDLLGVWRPANSNLAKLFLTLVASVPLIAFIIGTWQRFRRHKE